MIYVTEKEKYTYNLRKSYAFSQANISNIVQEICICILPHCLLVLNVNAAQLDR